MEQQQKQLESIEKYLDGQLSESQKVEFEKQLRTDKAFRIYFEEIKLIIESVKSSARKNLLEKLRKTETNLESFGEAKTFHLKKYLVAISVAAGLVLLVGLSILLGQKKSDVKLEKYLAVAIEPYQNIIYPMQRTHENMLSTEQMAYYYYDAQKYSVAIQIFSTLELTGEEQQNARFYTANAYMGDGNYDKAIELFSGLLGQQTMFENQARWYMSLCLIKQGEKDLARHQLRQLTQTNTAYKVRAETLLTQLK